MANLLFGDRPVKDIKVIELSEENLVAHDVLTNYRKIAISKYSKTMRDVAVQILSEITDMSAKQIRKYM